MAYYFPQNKNALEALYGVGTVKKEKFGLIFLVGRVVKILPVNTTLWERKNHFSNE